MNLKNIVHAEDLFESLGREEKQEIKEFEFGGDTERLLDNFREVLKMKKPGRVRERYNFILNNAISGCSSKNIEALSILITTNYEDGLIWSDNLIGFYLSALINKSSDKDITIHVLNSGVLNFLGYKNEKNLTIRGNAGVFLAREMVSGIIKLMGDSDSFAGSYLRGGEIYIEGDAGGVLGSDMRGGKIIVNGNTGGIIGDCMAGGEIHLNGEYNGIISGISGKVYHRGKLIYENGREIE